jgi:putative ABC transport system permease protein
MFWFRDLMYISLRQVFRHHKLYTGVVFAIMLGTAGLIVLLTMGPEIKKKINGDLDLLGGVTIINAGFTEAPTEQGRIASPGFFYGGVVEALRKIPGVAEASLRGTKGAANALIGEHKYNFTVFAVDEYFWTTNGLEVETGQLIGKKEVENREKTVVLGPGLAKRLFPGENALGKLISIDLELFRVIGIVGGIGLGDRKDCAFIPFGTAYQRLSGFSLPERINVRCLTWDDVEKVAVQMLPVIGSRQPADRLRIEVGWEAVKRVVSITWWTQFLVYLSLCVTFILAGFGIWNSMMSAVQSRTREIGLKKAIGAEDGDIFLQFISEALFLSVGSALMGIAVGRIAVEILSKFLHIHPSQNMLILSMLCSVAFSLIIGLGGGIYPSLRASRMEVVSAIRYE